MSTITLFFSFLFCVVHIQKTRYEKGIAFYYMTFFLAYIVHQKFDQKVFLSFTLNR